MANPKLFRCSIVSTTTTVGPAYWLTLQGTSFERDAVIADILKKGIRLAVDPDPNNDHAILINGSIGHRPLGKLVRIASDETVLCSIMKELYGEALQPGISMWCVATGKYILDTTFGAADRLRLTRLLNQQGDIAALPVAEPDGSEDWISIQAVATRESGSVAAEVNQALGMFYRTQ